MEMELVKYELLKENYKLKKKLLTKNIFILRDKSKWRYPECL